MDQRIPQIRFSAAPPFVPPTSNRWDSRKCIAASTTRRLAHHCIHAAGTRNGTQFKNLRLSLMDGEKTVFSADAAEIQSQVAYPTNSVRAPLEKLVERVRQAGRDDDAGFLQRQMERAKRDLPELEGKAGQPFPKADELATKRARIKYLVSVLDANNKQAPAASERAAEDDDAAYMGAPDNEDAERQFRETEKVYGGKAAYDKAKAAGKTNLNYRHWVQVRTPNFKAWFGYFDLALVTCSS